MRGKKCLILSIIQCVLFFFLILAYSCSSSPVRDSYFFQIPNLGVYEQSTIKEFEKNRPVSFSQYEGFYITTKDSLFSKIILESSSKQLIHSNEIGKDQIEELKNNLIDSLVIQYSLKEADENFKVKDKLKMLFEEYAISEQNDGFLVKDRCDHIIARIEYNNLLIPNYQIFIYPSLRNCLR